MRRLSLPSWGVQMFFFLEGAGLGFFFVFPSYSQCVPHYIPMRFSKGSPSCSSQWFPNSTSVLSHAVCPKFNSQVYQLRRWAIEAPFVSILWLGVQRGASIGECPIFQKIDDGSINMAPSNKPRKRKRKSCELTHELISTNVCYVPHNLFFSLVPNVFSSCSHEVISKGSSQFPSWTWRRSQ
jgi:hypothetical protein